MGSSSCLRALFGVFITGMLLLNVISTLEFKSAFVMKECSVLRNQSLAESVVGNDEDDQETVVIVPHNTYKPRFRLSKNHTLYTDYDFVVGSEYFASRHDDIANALKDTLEHNQGNKIMFVFFTAPGEVPRDLPPDLNYLVYSTDILLYSTAMLFLNFQFPPDKILVYRNSDVSVRRLHQVRGCTMEKTLYFLSRSDELMPRPKQKDQVYGDCKYYMNQGSNDVYIFRSNANQLGSAFASMNFALSMYGVENMYAYIVNDHGYDVVNLCGHMQSMHFHPDPKALRNPDDVTLPGGTNDTSTVARITMKKFRINAQSLSPKNALVRQKCNVTAFKH